MGGGAVNPNPALDSAGPPDGHSSRSGGLGSCAGRSETLSAQGVRPITPTPTSLLLSSAAGRWALRRQFLETAPGGSPARPWGPLQGSGWRRCPPAAAGSGSQAPGPPPLFPGDPLSPAPSRAQLDTPPPGGRALSARRRPRPAPRGDSPGPRPLPPTPGAGAGRGGDGDWAAARGRVLGREARRPLSFSAPAPPPPPPSLLAPAAAAEVGALAGPPRLLPQPGPSPSAAPPPLAAAASLLPPPSRSFPERPAGRERGGCEEA